MTDDKDTLLDRLLKANARACAAEERVVELQDEAETAKQRTRARAAVSFATRTGKLPRARTVMCVDCVTSPAAEYDHHAGYDSANVLNVQPVCKPCHTARGVARGSLGRPREYDQLVCVAFTSDDLALIDAAATRAKMKRTAWIRTTLLKAAALAGALFLAVACDEYVEQDSPPEPSAVRLDTAAPVVHPWPTASQSVTAECSGYCRWEVRCAGAELGACEADCYHALCDGIDCEAQPSGTDDVLEICIRAMHIEAMSPQACTAGAEPFSWGAECIAAVRPVTCDDVPTAGSPDL